MLIGLETSSFEKFKFEKQMFYRSSGTFDGNLYNYLIDGLANSSQSSN